MNINITSMPGIHDSLNMAAASELNYREVKQEPAVTNEESQKKREVEEFKKSIRDAVTMDSTEVRDFLFMLIGSSVKIRPEANNSGSIVNMMA